MYRVLFTGHADVVASARHFPVRVHPERQRGLYGEMAGSVRGDAPEHIVLSTKGGGQGEQYQELGEVPHRAQVQQAVPGVRVRGEHEAAALEPVQHAGREQHIADVDGSIVL